MALHHRKRKPPGIQGWSKAVFLFVVYVTVTSAAGLMYGMQPESKSSMLSLNAFITITSILSIVAVAIFRTAIDKRSFVSLGFHRSAIMPDVLSGFLLAMFLVCAGACTLYLLNVLTWTSVDADRTVITSSLILLVAAFSEELVFRGYILRSLMKSFGRPLSLAISSLLFTLVHLMNPGIPYIGIFNILLGGFVLGILFLRTRSLWMPLSFHFAWNFFQGPVLGFDVSGLVFHPIFQANLHGAAWLTGDNFGFEGSLICTVILMILLILLTWRRKKTLPEVEEIEELS